MGPPGARPFDSCLSSPCLGKALGGYSLSVHRRQGEGKHMPMWVWILLIVLLVLLVFGGVGYGRRGV